MTERRPLLITFEGTEGSGKTTQLRLLAERLRARGLAVTINQEPGATRIGSQIRRILLDPEHREMAPITELLLMFASRAQAAAEIIVPALERADIVLSDRFTDSTLAYQGEARGLGLETVLAVHRLALGSLWPDLTICLVVDVETGLMRASETRMEQQPLEFHKRVEAGYRKIAESEPERFRIIDGAGEPAQVAERVWAEVARRLADNKD
ncbi:MAG TPA: dTMP kinase [Bryobacteraceae bacterium]|jgi:dTMP kinase|nr:dTMP kinase [Bryobacteraceae bacterium]